MSAITTTNRDLVSDWSCSICKDRFEDQYKPTTHVGGETHGFCKPCLKSWVIQKLPDPTCPNCRVPIDPSDLFSRTEQIIMKLKSAITNAVYGACFGLVGSALPKIGADILAGASTALITAVEAMGLETGIVIPEETITAVAMGGAAVTGALLAVAAQSGATRITRTMEIGILTTGITTIMVGTGTAIAKTTLLTTTGTGIIGTGIGVAGAFVGTCQSKYFNLFLNIRKFSWIDRKAIGLGMCVGSLAGLVAVPFIQKPWIVATTVGGIATGILTLIRG